MPTCRYPRLPTVPLDDLPAGSPSEGDEDVVRDFRRLVRQRLGSVAVAVLDTRLAGEETKSLVGSASLGSPGKWIIKRTVCQIKALARDFFSGDPEMLRKIEKAMAEEEETVEKRRTTTAARMGVGA